MSQALNTPNFISKVSGIIFDISILVICALSLVLSSIESVVNLDSYHWGFMYGQAVDTHNGLIPHKDVFIFYGYLTSWVQGLSLTIIGEKLQSIGIATGIFYSISLFLCYRVFIEFTKKSLAFLTVSIIFLLHSYIIFPWSNYFSYPLQILSILFFIKHIKNKGHIIYVFAAGFSIGTSILFRYSSCVISLVSYFSFILHQSIIQHRNHQDLSPSKSIFVFTIGLLLPIGAFLQYLSINNAVSDFLIQYQIPLDLHKINDFYTFRKFIFNLFTFRNQYGHNLYIRDLRSFLFTLIFIWVFITVVYFLKKSMVQKIDLNSQEQVILLICFFTLFGYLNSIHIYEVFRLANSSSIGLGVVAYTIEIFLIQSKKIYKLLAATSISVICYFLVISLTFTQTSSAYFPWRLGTLMDRRNFIAEMNIFRGKAVPKAYYNRYHRLYKQLSILDESYYIINYPEKELAAEDPIAMLINDSLKRPQRSTLFYSGLAQVYPEEEITVKKIIDDKKAIIFSRESIRIPGYKVFDYSCYENFCFSVNIPEAALRKL